MKRVTNTVLFRARTYDGCYGNSETNLILKRNKIFGNILCSCTAERVYYNHSDIRTKTCMCYVRRIKLIPRFRQHIIQLRVPFSIIYNTYTYINPIKLIRMFGRYTTGKQIWQRFKKRTNYWSFFQFVLCIVTRIVLLEISSLLEKNM